MSAVLDHHVCEFSSGHRPQVARVTRTGRCMRTRRRLGLYWALQWSSPSPSSDGSSRLPHGHSHGWTCPEIRGEDVRAGLTCSGATVVVPFRPPPIVAGPSHTVALAHAVPRDSTLAPAVVHTLEHELVVVQSTPVGSVGPHKRPHLHARRLRRPAEPAVTIGRRRPQTPIPVQSTTTWAHTPAPLPIRHAEKRARSRPCDLRNERREPAAQSLVSPDDRFGPPCPVSVVLH